MIKGFFAVATAMLVGFSAQAGLEDYAGSYSGKFERTKGSMIVSVNGGVLSASFVGANGSNDILGASCGSSIGQLVKIDMDGAELDYAVFAFDPGACAFSYQGREITLDFKHDNGKIKGLNVSIYVDTTSTTDWHCTGYPGGGSSCYPQTTTHNWYATGKFKK